MKKVMSILAIALLVATLAIGVFAADAKEPTLRVDVVEGVAGDIITVNVSIVNNPGITDGKFKVSYDATALEPVIIDPDTGEELEPDNEYGYEFYTFGGRKNWSWFCEFNPANGEVAFASSGTLKGDCALISFTFRVKENVLPGTYKVTADVESDTNYFINKYIDEDTTAVAIAGKTFEGGLVVPCVNHVGGEAKIENLVEATCKTEGSYDEVVYCVYCEKELSRDAKTIAKLAHTAAAAVKENEVAPTCTAEGSYDEVVYCSVCGEELSRDAKTIAKLAHTAAAAVKENEVAPTCTAEGSYDEVVYCSVCGEELSRVTKTVAMVDHTAAEAVKENIVGATCQVPGSYDEVVYCSVCGKELSRTHVDGQLADHVAGQTKKENEVAPTCTAAGSYDEVVYCSVCDKELSRNTVTVDALGHKPAAAVKENEVVGADCQTAGSYEEVVYCSVCGEELSREKKTGEVGAHKLVETVKEATCCEKGEKVVSCELCGHVESKEELAATGEHVLTYVDNNDGLTHKVICSNTGKELTAAEAHTYGEFIEDVENPGWKYQLCEKCGYKHVEEVPTGDNAMIAVAVATLSLMGVALVVSKKKEF